MKKMNLYLASISPRRSDLLKQAGFTNFTVIPADIQECLDQKGNSEQIAKSNAKLKTDFVSKKHPDGLVIGADTIVVFDDCILHKPIDIKDAHRMLRFLSGQTHSVITGICIQSIIHNIFELDFVTTKVTMKDLSDEQIAKYFEKVNPLDKSGAYAIQAGEIIQSYDGSLSNVIGLPIEWVQEKLYKYEIQS